jgi:hypothetical protein
MIMVMSAVNDVTLEQHNRLLALADTYHDFGYQMSINRSTKASNRCQIGTGNVSYNKQMLLASGNFAFADQSSEFKGVIDPTAREEKQQYDYEDYVIHVMKSQHPELFNDDEIFMNMDDDDDQDDIVKLVEALNNGDTTKKVGIFIDTVNMSRVKSIFAPVVNPPPDAPMIYNLSCIAQTWDQANSVNENRVHVKIQWTQPTQQPEKVNVFETFDTNVAFGWEPEQPYTLSHLPYTLSHLLFKNAHIADEALLKRGRLKFSVMNMCHFMSDAYTQKKNNVQDFLPMMAERGILVANDATHGALEDALPSIYTDKSHPQTRIANILYDVKRSMDYGQAKLVEFLNSHKDNVKLVPTQVFRGKRQIKGAEGYVDQHVFGGASFYLMTFDRLCWLKCKLKNIPTIFIQSRLNKVYISKSDSGNVFNGIQNELAILKNKIDGEIPELIEITDPSNSLQGKLKIHTSQDITPLLNISLSPDDQRINIHQQVLESFDNLYIQHNDILSSLRVLFDMLNRLSPSTLHVKVHEIETQVKELQSNSDAKNNIYLKFKEVLTLGKIATYMLGTEQRLTDNLFTQDNVKYFSRKMFPELVVNKKNQVFINLQQLGINLVTMSKTMTRFFQAKPELPDESIFDVPLPTNMTNGKIFDMYKMKIQNHRKIEQFLPQVSQYAYILIHNIELEIDSLKNFAENIDRFRQYIAPLTVTVGGADKRPGEHGEDERPQKSLKKDLDLLNLTGFSLPEFDSGVTLTPEDEKVCENLLKFYAHNLHPLESSIVNYYRGGDVSGMFNVLYSELLEQAKRDVAKIEEIDEAQTGMKEMMLRSLELEHMTSLFSIIDILYDRPMDMEHIENPLLFIIDYVSDQAETIRSIQKPGYRNRKAACNLFSNALQTYVEEALETIGNNQVDMEQSDDMQMDVLLKSLEEFFKRYHKPLSVFLFDDCYTSNDDPDLVTSNDDPDLFSGGGHPPSFLKSSSAHRVRASSYKPNGNKRRRLCGPNVAIYYQSTPTVQQMLLRYNIKRILNKKKQESNMCFL